MKRKLPVIFSAALLLLSVLFVPASAAEEGTFNEKATVQSFCSLVAYTRMCKGQSPLYILDNGDAPEKTYGKTGSVGKVQNLIDGIVAFKKESDSVQGWINSGLTATVKTGAEWYVLGLSQSGQYDFSAYEAALLGYLRETPPTALQTAQNLALTLIAVGSQDPLIQQIADISVAAASVMPQVFGLHLLNNGVKSASYTAEEVIGTLLAMQRKDGGWAVAGAYGDVDVTAMVLEALTPHYGEAKVKAAVDRALAFLSARQNADGSFSSIGVANCESTAQVIVALSDLRIDCQTDARFIKNGKSPIDGLLIFRLADGSFCHTIAPAKSSSGSKTASVSEKSGAAKTENSSGTDPAGNTAQNSGAGKAKTAKQEPEKKTADQQSETASENEQESGRENTAAENSALSETAKEGEEQSKTAGSKENKKIGYKPIAAAALCLLAAGAAVLLAALKKATRKNLLLTGLILAASLLFVFGTNFESVDRHKEVKEKTGVVGTVTLSIRCDTVAGKGDPDFIPTDGCMLDTAEFEIEEGDTVYDVLEEATKRYDIHMEKKGTDGFVYVAAIGHLYELQFGEMSGWVYHVNGDSPFVGCDAYTVSDGDTIEWMYTLDLGVDVGNTFDAEGDAS